MQKYLVEVNYLGEGIKGLAKEGGTSRRDVVKKMIESLGGKLETFYYAFGDRDLYVIADLPDNVSMTATALTVSSLGGVATKTIVLLTPEEVDQAVKKTPLYRAPGK